jgi:ATP-binding cassette subfamily F protein uup
MTILMKNPNFLILDEPTNDLDIFTLNVLEEYLVNFKGSVIVVSHDRYFMDRVADHLFVFDGNGTIKNFPGNYTDYYFQQKSNQKTSTKEKRALQAEKPQVKRGIDKPRKLSYKEKIELEELERDIETLEEQKASLETEINSGQLSTDELISKSKELNTLLKNLEKKENRWLELKEIEDL